MSDFMLIQGLPLAESMREEWKNVGALITRTNRTPLELLERWARGNYEFVLNYGMSGFFFDGTPRGTDNRLWNDGRTINLTRTPGALRRLMPELLPPFPEQGCPDFWIKRPGYGGRGKTRVQGLPVPTLESTTTDLQVHIEGTEYRINTVGTEIVQAHLSSGHREDVRWQWINHRDVNAAVREAAYKAAIHVGPNTCYGWDIMHDTINNIAYILEGNSAAGTNGHTAQRIVNAIRAQRGL